VLCGAAELAVVQYHKVRLDSELAKRKLVASRSQAEHYIKMGCVQVNDQIVFKPAAVVGYKDVIVLTAPDQYVSRAGHKLASVAARLKIDFRDKSVLDVGSSTGGFTDYALQHGAKKVVAVDVGSQQLHAKLRSDSRVELYEQTDIRSVQLRIHDGLSAAAEHVVYISAPDIILIDVSFVSLRDILPHVASLMSPHTILVAMMKPQFEATAAHIKHKGVIKNDRLRRELIKEFEYWIQKLFKIEEKADSEITGVKGNRERFYRLKKLI
jgi:23S rRNA (cytidine1920-2'-O)/16S rRNA (cytidine1409-2'-O)-methyltransferase